MNRACVEYPDNKYSVIEDNCRARIVCITKNNKGSNQRMHEIVVSILTSEDSIEKLENKKIELETELNKSNKDSYMKILRNTGYAVIAYPFLFILSLFGFDYIVGTGVRLAIGLGVVGIALGGGGTLLYSYLLNRYFKKRTKRELTEVLREITSKKVELNKLKESYGIQETIINDRVLSPEAARGITEVLGHRLDRTKPFASNYLKALDQYVHDYNIPEDLNEQASERIIICH